MSLDSPFVDLEAGPGQPRRQRSGRLWLIAAVLAVSVIGLLARPGWQRSRDLQFLEQAGAVFDTRTKAPKWMKLVGSTLDPAAIDSLARVTTLEDLVLDESTVTDDDLATLAALTSLRRLSLARTAISDRGLSHLAGLLQLKTLVLDSSYHVTDGGLDAVAAINGLEDVSLLDIPVTLPALVELSGRHTSLQINSSHGVLGNRKLALSGTEISDEGLARLYNAAELEGIELPSRITDRGLQHLYGLSKLKYVVLAGSRITDRGLAALIDRSLPLTEIDISGCSGLTDTGLALVARLPLLRQLQVDNTNAGPHLLTAVAELAQLELLSLGDCLKVDDTALRPLLDAPSQPRLKFLRLSGTAITDISMKTVDRDRFPNLEGLDLRNTRVTPETTSLLRKRLAGCRVLGSSAAPGLRAD